MNVRYMAASCLLLPPPAPSTDTRVETRSPQRLGLGSTSRPLCLRVVFRTRQEPACGCASCTSLLAHTPLSIRTPPASRLSSLSISGLPRAVLIPSHRKYPNPSRPAQLSRTHAPPDLSPPVVVGRGCACARVAQPREAREAACAAHAGRGRRVSRLWPVCGGELGGGLAIG